MLKNKNTSNAQLKNKLNIVSITAFAIAKMKIVSTEISTSEALAGKAIHPSLSLAFIKKPGFQVKDNPSKKVNYRTALAKKNI